MIETTRLLLRLPEAADAQALMEIHLDPEVLEQGLVTLIAHPTGSSLLFEMLTVCFAKEANNRKRCLIRNTQGA